VGCGRGMARLFPLVIWFFGQRTEGGSGRFLGYSRKSRWFPDPYIGFAFADLGVPQSMGISSAPLMVMCFAESLIFLPPSFLQPTGKDHPYHGDAVHIQAISGRLFEQQRALCRKPPILVVGKKIKGHPRQGLKPVGRLVGPLHVGEVIRTRFSRPSAPPPPELFPARLCTQHVVPAGIGREGTETISAGCTRCQAKILSHALISTKIPRFWMGTR